MGIFPESLDFESLPDIPKKQCLYCGYIGYEFDTVYICDDFDKKMRTLHRMCSQCKVLDSATLKIGEYKPPIDTRTKRKK